MSSLSERIANLTPSQRAALETRLKERGLTLPESESAVASRRPAYQAPVLSFAQERLWFFHQLEPASPVYNVAAALRLKGALNRPALERALNAVVDRHRVLRTLIENRDGVPVPVETDRPLVLADLPPGPDLKRILREEGRRAYDLSRDLPVRAGLARLADDEHVLLVGMHHIVSDEWSLRILVRELGELYSAAVLGRAPALPTLPLQYADYARAQKEQLRDEVLAGHIDFWRRQLAGSPPLELPTSHRRPARQSDAGGRVLFTIEWDLTRRLRGLATSHRATVFMLMAAAFQALLSRYTGQTDFLIGANVANRNSQEIENLIGVFVNTLTLRANLDADPSFAELLRRVRASALDAYSHLDLPFEKLVNELQPERSPGRHSPLFLVAIVFYSEPVPALDFAGLEATAEAIALGTSKFDLLLAIRDRGDRFSAWFEYNAELFEAEAMRRLAGHYVAMLESAAANPALRVSQLEMLTAPEREELREWNETRKDYPGGLLHELFEAEAKRAPNQTAIVFGRRRITYAELDARADRLARRLRALGVGPDVTVPICVRRSPGMVTGVLAILKAGGAYVPLDPSHPPERLAFLIEDCAGPVVVANDPPPEALARHGASIVCIDGDGDFAGDDSGDHRAVAPSPGNLAYVIYTSGSTGKPKGVAIEHRNAVAFVQWARDEFPAEDFAGALASSTLTFDWSIFELFVPLSRGGTIVLVENVLHLPDIPAAEEVRLASTVPSAMSSLLTRGRLPRSLRTLLIGGERLDQALVKQVFDSTSVQFLYDGYGPAECTTLCTIAQRTPEGPETIGKPIANAQVYILDRHMQPVPVGAPGEIYIGGSGVARGYLRRPALTAERFIPDSFSAEPGARLYKSGDMGRFRAGGEIEFIGRRDHQVKFRGFRIELEEIEAALSGHPRVQHAAVVMREDQPGEQRLVAYCSAKGGEKLRAEDLSDWLEVRLPAYMLPSRYVLLDALPFTQSGKIDRRALPAPAPLVGERAIHRPADSIEAELTRIWERTLNVHPIGVRDNFFDLGGYSLLAVKLFADIERAFGKDLPLATLFESPTIEGLARLLRREGWQPSWAALIPIQATGSRPPLFCVHAAGGNVLFYREMAVALGADQPVYGLQAIGLDGKRAPLTTVEAMAEAYLSEMLAVQPEGPYLLGGFCSGAYVALEMARQLEARGKKVALLVSFNTDGNWKLVRSFWQGVRYHFRHLARLRSSERVGYLLMRVRYRINRPLGWLVRILRGPSRTASAIPALRSRQIEEVIRHAVARYEPGSYTGSVVYFQGKGDYFRDPGPFWRDLVGGRLEIETIHGRAFGIFREPYVQELAARLKKRLDEAAGGG
ncbi:MAG: amino acid adenylation domain-containing protein [Bryobacteraceae bacterium]|nr:amino acid adenylation domain-containing protein [Bryobacteraceae bacterium]